MKIVYLDYDGVLHHENVWRRPRRGICMEAPGHSLFEWLPILDYLLSPHPEVKIVLSTSWVVVKSYDFARSCLTPALRPRVIGATYHRRHHDAAAFMAMSRGEQIVADLARRSAEAWFAIDDDAIDWPAWARKNLVLTAGETGINEPAVQIKITKMLRSMSK